MRLLRSLRVILVLNVLIMLVQAGFAGRMLSGDGWGAFLHENTAKALVLLACCEVMLTITLRIKLGCPLWVLLASATLLVAEVVEFAAGHVHNVALHVPLGVAIFGGALRLVFWSMRETNVNGDAASVNWNSGTSRLAATSPSESADQARA
jgi:hypothetical protein